MIDLVCSNQNALVRLSTAPLNGTRASCRSNPDCRSVVTSAMMLGFDSISYRSRTLPRLRSGSPSLSPVICVPLSYAKAMLRLYKGDLVCSCALRTKSACSCSTATRSSAAIKSAEPDRLQNLAIVRALSAAKEAALDVVESSTINGTVLHSFSTTAAIASPGAHSRTRRAVPGATFISIRSRGAPDDLHVTSPIPNFFSSTCAMPSTNSAAASDGTRKITLGGIVKLIFFLLWFL
mmetsp:Transcript_9507/g.27114  ORF Transcript_9507/g.27114 Transcript_9507/m.27114 type:complete len:236 (+) Transcript_9507:660-1367(+)